MVAPEDTWARFVASGLSVVEAGALPGCVTHPGLWGERLQQLSATDVPEHGYSPGRCGAVSRPFGRRTGDFLTDEAAVLEARLEARHASV